MKRIIFVKMFSYYLQIAFFNDILYLIEVKETGDIPFIIDTMSYKN